MGWGSRFRADGPRWALASSHCGRLRREYPARSSALCGRPSARGPRVAQPPLVGPNSPETVSGRGWRAACRVAACRTATDRRRRRTSAPDQDKRPHRRAASGPMPRLQPERRFSTGAPRGSGRRPGPVKGPRGDDGPLTPQRSTRRPDSGRPLDTEGSQIRDVIDHRQIRVNHSGSPRGTCFAARARLVESTRLTLTFRPETASTLIDSRMSVVTLTFAPPGQWLSTTWTGVCELQPCKFSPAVDKPVDDGQLEARGGTKAMSFLGSGRVSSGSGGLRQSGDAVSPAARGRGRRLTPRRGRPGASCAPTPTCSRTARTATDGRGPGSR